MDYSATQKYWLYLRPNCRRELKVRDYFRTICRGTWLLCQTLQRQVCGMCGRRTCCLHNVYPCLCIENHRKRKIKVVGDLCFFGK